MATIINTDAWCDLIMCSSHEYGLTAMILTVQYSSVLKGISHGKEICSGRV